MDFDYFSIDAILGENQKIQCTFKQDMANMGHLTGGTDKNITANSKAQIPIWLAYTLIYSDWADFNIPPAFGARVRNALKAEACSVRLANLVGQGGQWYGFGKTIMDILSDEQAEEMSDVLVKAFRGRLVEVIDQAQHFAALSHATGGGPSSNTAQSFREGLDTTERELFWLAQESAKRTKQWYESK